MWAIVKLFTCTISTEKKGEKKRKEVEKGERRREERGGERGEGERKGYRCASAGESDLRRGGPGFCNTSKALDT